MEISRFKPAHGTNAGGGGETNGGFRQSLSGLDSQISSSSLCDLQSITINITYPVGAVLFEEGQVLKGVFVLKSGLVKLTATSSEGKTLILRLIRPGGILGLSAAISERPYDSCAVAVHRGEAEFIRLDDFSRFLAGHIEIYEAISRDLISQQNDAWSQLRMVGLCTSASGRLARLLIDWSASGQHTNQGIRITVPLTHEEIGECISTSRETVSRTLSEFKNRGLISFQGSTLTISNSAGLQKLAN